MVIGSNCCALDLIRFNVKCLFVNRVINKNVAVCWLCKKCSHCDKMPYYEAEKKGSSHCTMYIVSLNMEFDLVKCCAIAQRQESSIIMYFECLPLQLIPKKLICKYFTNSVQKTFRGFFYRYTGFSFPHIFLVMLKPKL